MTREEALEILTRKLARRRALNEPAARSHRVVTGPVPQSIGLTFRECEGLIALLTADESHGAA